MLRLLLVFISINSFQIALGQDLSVFHDNRDDFHVFDHGKMDQLEFLPVKNYKVDNPYLAYITNDSKFKVYDNRPILLHKRVPTWFSVNDSFLVYRFFNSLYVYRNNKVEVVEKLVEEPIAFNHNVIAYNDNLDFFQIYDFDTTKTIEQTPVKKVVGKENMLVYYGPFGDFKLYTNGKLEILEFANFPRQFKLARNIVAYIDYDNIFKVYYNGEIHELESFPPKMFRVGENMVAYIDNLGEFKVFYKGEVHDLLSYRPNQLGVHKNILYYTDRSDYFFTFYKGEKKRLETYAPDSVKVDRNFMVYTDLDRGLKAFINGNIKQITEQSVRNFEVIGKVVNFSTVPQHLKIYWNGRIYKAF